MPDIDLIVQNDGRLRPSLPADLEKIKKYKPGMIIRAKVWRQRNAAHSRKWWALIGAVLPHMDYEDKDDLADDIKLKLGLIQDYRVDWLGRVVVKTKSIAFDKMDQNEFDIFYRRTIDALLNDFLEEWTTDDIESALEMVRSFG